MKAERKHVLVGVLTGIFLSPFVGGGIAGYLNSQDVREGTRYGGVVGVLTGLLFGGTFLIVTYYSRIQPVAALEESGAPPWGGTLAGPTADELLLQFVLASGVIFGIVVVSALIGGGIGGYLRDRGTGRSDTVQRPEENTTDRSTDLEP